MTTLLSLPNEILLLIASPLPPYSLYSLTLTSRYFSQLFLQSLYKCGVHHILPDKSTPLHWAACNGYLELATSLIKHGADVNLHTSATGFTGVQRETSPLQHAASGGHAELLKLLLENSADVNGRSGRYCKIVIHFAARKGSDECVQLLLDYGADINSVDFSYITPLHLAAEHNHESTVRLLLYKGANIAATDYELHNSAHYAARCGGGGGGEGIFTLLLEKGVKIGAKSTFGSTVLMIASSYGSRAIVRLLLDMDVDIDAHDIGNLTALHYAAMKGEVEILRMLLEKEADINGGLSKKRLGKTPLYIAARYKHEECMAVLLSAGADTEIRTTFGVTVLHEMAARGKLNIVRMLVEGGADVDAKVRYLHGTDNIAPVSIAAGKEWSWGEVGTDKPVVPLDGVYPNVKNIYGWTVMMIAEKEGEEDVVKFLKEGGGLGQDNQPVAISNSH